MGLMQPLIEQSKNPSGLLGKVMLRIMNNAHRSLTVWGLSMLKPADKILDVSCGGGNAVSLMAASGRFRKIHGIDFSPDAVSSAAAKKPAAA